MAAEKRDLAQLNADIQEQKERVENVDFKMVTFSLAGKDYGVDIMNVKEIAKADKFTYVPNAASFVRGVYNLRGDIIPIIDLRMFFHLPYDKKSEGQENMLILRINEQVYGTIVDKIDKVVGINHESIQPPHPIFGDINIKYISGVVEKHGDLYIILDVIRIFSINEEEKGKTRTSVTTESGDYFVPPPVVEQIQDVPTGPSAESAIGFVKEGLKVLRHFGVSPLNEKWLHSYFAEWSIGRSGEELQLKTASDADEFLSSFHSPCTGAFWDENYAAAVKASLPDFPAANLQVWNIGCGKGYETFSFACILKSRYPDKHLKIWANDSDIMAISQAPNMVFDLDEIPEYCRSFMAKGKSGYSFNQVIRDSIVFEFHDILNDNPLPELDIIMARDLLSFLTEQEQKEQLSSFSEKLKNRGIAILGKNEELSGGGWRLISSDPVSMYMHSA
ncbi:MAG: chemotaxis protein CheW [Treponema sp.]|jgi:purine-binding chemotaxis protein CheW|nr:chemotaxis protein CheW [Treponema sp.]